MATIQSACPGVSDVVVMIIHLKLKAGFIEEIYCRLPA